MIAMLWIGACLATLFPAMELDTLPPSAEEGEETAVVVQLRDAATIAAPRVFLRDVAEVRAPAADVQRLGAIDLGAVPAAGAERVLNPAGVLLAVRKAGVALDARAIGGARRTVIRGVWRRWEPQPAVDEALRFARRELRDVADRLVVRTAGTVPAVSLREAEGEWSFDPGWASDQRGPGRVAVRVAVHRGRAQVGEVEVPLEVEHFTRALRLLRPLARGESVSPSMVASTEVALGRSRGVPVTRIEQLRDHVARRDLRASAVLERADFQPRLVVKRGDEVRVIHRVGGLQIAVRGVARRDGRVGEVIPVRNPDSGKDVMVRLIGGGGGTAVVARLQ